MRSVRLGHRDHIVRVDRIADREGLTGGVGPAQRDRRGGRELRAVGLPHRVRAGRGNAVLADPANLRIVLRRGARRREQAHRRARLVQRLTVAGECQVIDQATQQIDRALEPGRIDGDAVAGGERLNQILLLKRDVGRSLQAAFARGFELCRRRSGRGGTG